MTLDKNYSFSSPAINTKQLKNLGTCDFIAYWGASKCLSERKNPYDIQNIFSAQQNGGFAYSSGHPFMNPPWALPVVLPLAAFTFPDAVNLWIGLSLILVIVSTLLVWRANSNTKQNLCLCLIASLTFYPLVETLFWGQFGVVLCFGMAGFYWAHKRENQLMQGVFAAVLFMKPHVVFLFFIALAFWSLHGKKWKFLVSASLTVISLSLVSELIAPGSFSGWLDSVAASDSIKNTRASASLPGIIRLMLHDGNSIPPTWPKTIVPLLACLLFAFRLRKNSWNIDWDRDLLFTLAVGFLCTPYVWTHDFTLLLIAFPMLASAHANSKKICLGFIVFNLLCFSLSYLSSSPAISFFWIPLPFLLLTHLRADFSPKTL